MKIEKNVRIPVRDGVHLAADIYRPDVNSCGTAFRRRPGNISNAARPVPEGKKCICHYQRRRDFGAALTTTTVTHKWICGELSVLETTSLCKLTTPIETLSAASAVFAASAIMVPAISAEKIAVAKMRPF
jgi:hypothetical protein